MALFSPPVPFESLGLDPVALSIGPFALRWYSLAYIVGILGAWWMLRRMIRRPGAPLTAQHLDDLVAWCTLGVILGGRLAYVLFYDFADYLHDPLSVFRLWEGGMSFHGGLVGVLVALIWYGRRHGIQILRAVDYVAVVAPFALFLGRCANFVNGELWGRPTDGSWGIIFPRAGPLPRIPSQLIEATFEGLVPFVVFLVLFRLTKWRLRPGLFTGLFALNYGVVRFLVEFLREPDRQLGVLSFGLTMGQTLSLPLIGIGAWLLLTLDRRPRVSEECRP